ncbi:glucose-6-phosphate isomerase [Novosphingobium album (ex Liu et al. 2023)]|uniref:Glucose-6-phosphate isomerase n=1 Tax=Novosphingobium album (ex Liu et al. 2023) TaxID=3031130 RepID=A0ABT5WWU6_9SPHN|nr:glucose-6-phosphate isomerase [Novosphingobium album (ex Liu et al. 2023)]MDE8654380.1 glucose-6-phosphate isomerase [Novosphingobium album (ex Liu et al. 2023)]
MSESISTAWQALANLPKPRLAELFAADPARLAKLSARLELPEDGMRFDWSKTHLDDAHIAAFEALAEAMDFAGRRAALFAGEIVNVTEGRAAEHTAQRGVGNAESVARAMGYHSRMAAIVEAIHRGAMGDVKHLIHVGIGGSALGPALAVDALARDGAMMDVHVVSNIDGCALEAAFAACDPAATMLAVASKTFTTIETMTNAESVLDWLRGSGVTDPYGRVVALTAAPEKAIEWGVDETRVLPFSESVGGRYSLWSSIGFPIAIALGWPDFAELLEGAATVDRHFLETDGAANLCLRAAFADQYYTRLRRCQTRAVFAYDERLALLPDYLQQLEMESNGKAVTAEGQPVDGPTAPITWGGVGTDAQHAVFQLLHQGTNLVPVDFIAAITPGDDLAPAHHRILLSNCFAQGAALMAGKPSEDLARAYPGDRPSATILLDALTPASFGALIAFHEHRTFANAVLMGINPFDQFGVELGKAIAKQIEQGGASFDPSTEALLAQAGIA